ncbi:MAG: BamA/OMP85 family outer membrane protein [Armatimonadota bacterium]
MPAMARFSLLVLLLLAAALLTRAQVIREVVFRGAENLPAAGQQALGEAAQPLIGQRYDENIPGVLQEAVVETGWVSAARVTTEPVENDVRLIVEVTPNPPIEAVEFTGNTVLSTETLLAAIPLKPGDPFNPDLARQSAEAINQAYEDRGYTLTEVTDVTFTPEGVLRFTIREPRIGVIRFEGLNRTRERTVRQLLTVQPGDIYNVRDIQLSLANLQRLQIFDEISVTPSPGTEPGTVDLTFTVGERRTAFVLLGGTYNEVGGLSGYVIFGDRNLFGTAQQVNVQIQAGANEIYQLDYFNPLLGGPRNSLGASVFSRDTQRQVIVDGTSEFQYLARRTGGTLTLYRQANPTTQLFSTLRLADVRALPDENPNVPPIILGSSSVRSLLLGATRDTRLSTVYPVQGAFEQASIEGAGLLGGADFTKLTGEARRYFSLGGARGERPPRVLAARLLAGTSTGTPPFLDQFFLGGLDTLRGYEVDRFVGNNLLLFSSELRVPITESIQAVAFVDAGDAWGGRFAEALADDDFTFRLGYGVGARIVSPLGLIRFDYGLNIDGGNQLHFGIGTAF